jgi:hypothetical protein
MPDYCVSLMQAKSTALITFIACSKKPMSNASLTAVTPSKIQTYSSVWPASLVVDVCISSNLRTGAVKSLEEHPIQTFAEYGIPFTINTDDPFYFETDLYREYQLAQQLLPDRDWQAWAKESLRAV